DEAVSHQLTDVACDAGGPLEVVVYAPHNGAEDPPTVQWKAGYHVEQAQQDVHAHHEYEKGFDRVHGAARSRRPRHQAEEYVAQREAAERPGDGYEQGEAYAPKHEAGE